MAASSFPADCRVRLACRLGLALAAALTIGVPLSSAPARAYLMIIRQGSESAGLPKSGNLFGLVLATGDFDGDGFEDLASAAPAENEDIEPGHAHGSVVVNYGSAWGLTPEGAQYLTVGAVPDFEVRYGKALATGDFNKDGYDDLAVGLPVMDVGPGSTIADGGAVWIHYGSASGLSTAPGIVLVQSDAGGLLEAGDYFGFSLAVGDFDGDTYPDLAVGAIGENMGSGAISVFHGSAGGITTAGAVTYGTLDVGLAEQTGGYFGYALASGDMLGTGEDDLAIGCPYRRIGAGNVDAGQVVVLHGGASGLSASGAVVLDPITLGLNLQSQSWFGYSVAVGDLFATNAKRALAIGQPRYHNAPPTNVNSGRVVVLGQVVAPPPVGSMKLLEQYLVSDPQYLESPEPGDQFGWSLATGDWDNDGDDELAIGTPFENQENNPAPGWNTPDAGSVSIFEGDASFPIPAVFKRNRSLNARVLNDTLGSGDRLGESVAFGRFDGTGRANLAIGAPYAAYKDYLTGGLTASAGRVYVFAPWRQPNLAPHRASAALDCNGTIVYAQRPFQSAPLASITKAMTVLLATEAIQTGFDSSTVYVVPDWVANNVSGSEAGLVTGESIRFVDLIKLAVAISAGDACYAIGDILTGGNHAWNGLGGTLVDFQSGMNQRAQQLGMTRTHYSTPSGRPLSDNFSTAYDQALLIRQAMQNPLFRHFVGTREWDDIPGYSPVANGWLEGMQDSWYPSMDGVKPGNNAYALHTRLGSALAMNGTGRTSVSVIGVGNVSYGSPVSDSSTTTLVKLFTIADGTCGPGFATPPPPPPPGPWARFANVPTGPVPPVCRRFVLPDDAQGDAEVRLSPGALPAPPARGTLEIGRISEVVIAPGATASFGFSPVTTHLGFRLYDVGPQAADLEITTSAPVKTMPVHLQADEAYVVPEEAAAGPAYVLTVRNLSSAQPARLQVEEKGYQQAFAVDGSRAGMFAGLLERDPACDAELLRMCVTGGDSTDGNTLIVGIEPPGVPLGVGDPPAAAPGLLIAVRTMPLPFHGDTRIAFTLAEPATTTVAVFDVRGRRVRTLDAGTPRGAGPHEIRWDGRDADGQPVAAGVYWTRVASAAGTGVGRALKIR